MALSRTLRAGNITKKLYLEGLGGEEKMTTRTDRVVRSAEIGKDTVAAEKENERSGGGNFPMRIK